MNQGKAVTQVAIGRNVPEVRAQVRTFTNRLFQGASVRTVVHETGHGMLRRSWEAGTITREETLEMVKAVNAVMQGRTLKRGAFAGESLSLLDEAAYDAADATTQDRMLHEAVAEIMEAEVMRTRKRDKTAKALPMSKGVVTRGVFSAALVSLSPKLAGKFKALVEAVRGVVGLSSARALAMKKGIREGTLNEADLEKFLDKLTGRDLQAEHDGMVYDEHAAILGQEALTPTEDAPLSMAPLGPGPRQITEAPEVVKIESDPFSEVPANASLSAFGKSWNEWEKKHRQEWRKTVVVEEGPIQISQKTHNEMRVVKDGEDARLHYQAATVLPELLERSKLSAVEDESKGKPGIQEVHRRYAWADFPDGKRRNVLLTVFRWDSNTAKDTDTAYAEEVMLEVENEVATGSSSAAPSDGQTAATRGDDGNLARFQAGIKPEHRWSEEEISPFSLGGTRAWNFDKYQEAGRVFIGKDGKQRFEMDASQATFTGLANLNKSPGLWVRTLNEVIDWPELFENYRDLAGVRVAKTYLQTGERGNFDIDRNVIYLAENISNGQQASTLLHEIQHWIQEREGFAPGGNPIEEAMAFRDEVRNMGLADPEADQLSDVGFRRYRDLPGEKEARGVQARASMAAEERAANPFMAGWDAYSLAPAAMVDSMSMNAAARIKDPRVKAAIFTRMLDKLGALRRDRDELGIAFGKGYKRKAIDDPRKTASIRRERNMREALRREELEDEAHARHGGILHSEDLDKLKSQPVHGYLADPDSNLRGRLMSQSAAAAKGKTFFDPEKQGDYDGAGNASRSLFGGQLMPDQAAQELFDAGLIKEPTPVLNQGKATAHGAK